MRDKCSGKEYEEELEKEIKQVEEQEGSLTKEHVQLKKRLESLQVSTLYIFKYHMATSIS